MMRPSLRAVADARATLKAERDARKADRPAKFGKRPFPKAAHGRERDTGFLTWLHQDLPCIACAVLGETASPIEAAHQKIQAASRNVHKRLGVRPSDMWCVPLCRLHHREGPLCCDPAQTKFWSVIGMTPEDVADFCTALYRAYEQERDGAVVVREFASLASGNRAAA